MEQQESIAERKLYAVAPDGRGFELMIGVGKPYQISDDEWACSVQLRGLHNLRDQHGVDSWQALQLCHQLAAHLLTHFVQEGGQLFWEKDGEQVSVQDLFIKQPTF